MTQLSEFIARPPGKRKSWTAGEQDVLKRLCAAGKSYAEIADLLHRTQAAVRKRASDIGCALNTKNDLWSDDDVQLLLSMRAAGKDIDSIAAIINRSTRAIRTYLRKYDIDSHPTKPVVCRYKNHQPAVKKRSITPAADRPARVQQTYDKNYGLANKTEKNTTKKHRCLDCRKEFIYKHIGNWICPGCKTRGREAARGFSEYSTRAISQ